MSTTLGDVHPDIVHTHILPQLDGRSLSTFATVSSYLHTLCSDHNLWSQICKCTWPSITHPHVDAIISTFPERHKSFFHDSFPSLIVNVNNRHLHLSTHHPWPPQLISTVDIRYQSNVIYSTVHFIDTTADHFLSSELLVILKEDANRPIKVEVDEETLSNLKQSLTLNWILIDPMMKRAGNLSSIKPFSVKKDLVANETRVQYDTVLPGCDRNEMVQCRIQVVLGVGGVVKEVVMKLTDLDRRCLNGSEFLVVSRTAISGGNNVTRKVVVDDEERWRSRREFKEMKRERRESLAMKEKNKWHPVPSPSPHPPPPNTTIFNPDKHKKPLVHHHRRHPHLIYVGCWVLIFGSIEPNPTVINIDRHQKKKQRVWVLFIMVRVLQSLKPNQRYCN
ncbi:hypothetical protein QVD17_09049 [Tagetes erecta]|uniref:F-box domain-containing protein n=1 Tax=Tagetes erecta TaxID=13708 RepID=A0AAD8KZT8_TARER|nr:hypothetical protein QVD17_09049 [Tagetes erecta]